MRDEFSEMTGVVAKREGKKVLLRRDWEAVKDGIMEEVVREKFIQNPDLLKKLIDTGDMELVEGNRWHDKYWGVDLVSGEGENHLGIILMKLREELGGEDYLEKVERLRAEKAAAEQQAKESVEAERRALQKQLDALPEYNFTGMEFSTRAFGKVTIKRQEGNYLVFDARGSEKKFAQPGCIVQGFLIPEDAQVIENYKRRQELQELMKSLEKNGLPKREASGAGGFNYHVENRDLFDGTEDYYLAHCISADFSMSKGIVAEFNLRFGIGKMLKDSHQGYASVWAEEKKRFDCLLTGKVFTLVDRKLISCTNQ